MPDSWPWAFIDPTDADKLARRRGLDFYGTVAHVSSLAPLVALLVVRVLAWAGARLRGRHDAASVADRYAPVPHSPALKGMRMSAAGGWKDRWRRVRWWLDTEVEVGTRAWGRRGVWLASAAWTAWLAALCIVGTGNDYIHLARRFGHVAVSQLPLHYYLTFKSIAPVAALTGSSHEGLNQWHRALGRIVFLLLCVHASLYLNFFVLAGLFPARLASPVVAPGVAALLAVCALYSTALTPLRTWSYRLFFATHLVVAVSLPALVWLHVHHAMGARLYAAEALAGLLADVGYRKLTTVTVQARVESVPGTDLIRVAAPLPHRRQAAFASKPGSHVYLSIPPESRPASNPLSPASLIFHFLYNPFSIAAVNERSGELTLVARRRGGPATRCLARYADVGVDLSMPLCIEGPYGAAGNRLWELVGPDADRVLLVAGGVGGTFAVPVYRALQAEGLAAKASLVWAVRGAGEAAWVAASGKSILDEPNVHVFLTGGAAAGEGGSLMADHLEMDALRGGTASLPARHQRGPAAGRGRPDLAKVVDDVFRMGTEERVAVLVCGPAAMARDVRRHVGRWVAKGRTVLWHDESFDW